MCVPFHPPPRCATSDGNSGANKSSTMQQSLRTHCRSERVQDGVQQQRPRLFSPLSRDGGHLRPSPLTTRRRAASRELRLGKRRSLNRLWQNGSKHHGSEESGGPDGKERQRHSVKERTSILQQPQIQKQIDAPAAKPELNFHLQLAHGSSPFSPTCSHASAGIRDPA